MCQTPGWLKLRQWLEVKRDQSFPRPTDFKTIEEFSYAAMATSSLKQSIVEVLQYVDMQLNTATDLIKKQKADKDPFAIGG